MDPDAVPPDVASFSAGMTLTIGCKECPGAWTPDRACPATPRRPRSTYVRSLRPRAQKVVETKVQTCDGAAHEPLRLEIFGKSGRIYSK